MILVLLFVFYILLLRKQAVFRFNRVFLLTSVLFSALIPLIDFSFIQSKTIYYVQLPEISIIDSIRHQNKSSGLTKTSILLIIYAFISTLFVSKFLWDLFSIIRIRRLSKKHIKNNISIFVYSFQNFSFFNWIFIKEEDKNNTSIIEHEKAHSRLFHSFDILIIKILQCLFWFNPVVFFMERELRLQHEYEVDRTVLKIHKNTLGYQQMLLNQVFQTEFNLITNNFNQSFLKNRFTMMTKRETKKVKVLFPVLLLITIPIAIAYGINKEKIAVSETNFVPLIETESLISNSVIKETHKDTSQKFLVVENMPEFPGGEDALIKYVSSNLTYPEDAKKEGVTGRCFIQFVVEKDGSISNVEVFRSVGHNIKDENKKAIAKQCDDEAVRVIKSMPKWNPGEQRGKKVRVEYRMPITFNLGPK